MVSGANRIRSGADRRGRWRLHFSKSPDFYVRRRSYPGDANGQSLNLLRQGFAVQHRLSFSNGIYHECEVFTLEALRLAKRARDVRLRFKKLAARTPVEADQAPPSLRAGGA